MTGAITAPQQRIARDPRFLDTSIMPSDEAVAYLVHNPSKADQFDETFKMPPGTAKKVIARYRAMTGTQ